MKNSICESVALICEDENLGGASEKLFADMAYKTRELVLMTDLVENSHRNMAVALKRQKQLFGMAEELLLK